MSFLVISILVGLIPAAIARSKGRSFGLWWLYGVLIFIVALPHALMMQPNIKGLDKQAKLTGFRKCPSCAEFVRPDARVCKHCGRDIPASLTETLSSNLNPNTFSNLSAGTRADEIVSPHAQNFGIPASPVKYQQELTSTFGRRH